MAKTTTDRIVEQGNFDAYFQKRAGAALSPDVVHVSGLISVDITHNEEITNIAADDEPDYFSLKAPVTAEGTITIVSMRYSDYEKLYNVIQDDNGVLWLGGGKTASKVGFAFKTTILSESDNNSTNMLSYPNATIALPPKSTVTVDETGSTVSNIAIPFKASPVFWTDKTGKRERATVGVINSVDNEDVWEKLSDHVFTPDETIA